MATALSFPSATPALHPHHRHVIFRPNTHGRVYKFRCSGKNSTSNSSTKQDTEPQNVLLKMAWYSSELLGIAASFFRSPSNVGTSGDGLELSVDGSGVIDRAVVVDTIKEDFQRSYFVTAVLVGNWAVQSVFTGPDYLTSKGSILNAARQGFDSLVGNLTLNAYEEDCEFADPAGSFRGLRRFKRNCTNFGSLVDKSDMKLTKWEDLEDKGIGHWRFSCVLSFPWKPILSATGYTEYYFDAQTGKVCRHVEHWNVPKMALFKQILRPSRGLKNTSPTP